MSIYHILPAIALLLGIPLFFNKSKTVRFGYLAVVFGILFAMNALRYGIGNDYFHYRMILDKYATGGYGIIDMLKVAGCEPFYTLLMKLVVPLPYSVRYLALNALTAFISLLPVAIVAWRSRYPQITAFLYICLTFFYNSMNFTRQSMSAAIVFLSYDAMKKRKHWLVVLLALIGAMFHFSALIIIPVYFISLIKPSWQFYSILGVLSAGVFIFSDDILRLIFSWLDVRYSLYLDSFFLARGLPWVYIIVPSLVAVLHILIYFTSAKDDRWYGTFTTFAFIVLIIWAFGLKHLIIERFSLVIYLFMIRSLPDGLGLLHDRHKEKYKDKEGVHLDPAVILTLLFCVVSLGYDQFTIMANAHGVVPYASIFSPFKPDKERLEKRPRDCYFNASLIQFLYTVDRKDNTVIVVNNGTSNGRFTIEETIGLARFGIQNDVYDMHSYIACISDGKPVIRMAEDGVLTYHTELYEKYSIDLTSDAAGGIASMVVNDIEF
ncbi:MAG: EpsG family protein, partial [Oscillospiraceae bacterium]|nr:EpsG family protein [Oscillospiraceae bacterium]